jgi:hypothetical protein
MLFSKEIEKGKSVPRCVRRGTPEGFPGFSESTREILENGPGAKTHASQPASNAITKSS